MLKWFQSGVSVLARVRDAQSLVSPGRPRRMPPSRGASDDGLADCRDDRGAVVVAATGRALDQLGADLEVVVRVVRRSVGVDHEQEPDLSGVTGKGLAVRTVERRGAGEQLGDGQGPI